MNIYTRSCNLILYNKWRGLLDHNFNAVRLTGYNHYLQSATYLHDILANKGWIINCDEDAFVVNRKRILALIEYMQANGFDYCGMPDGGVHPNRSRAWVTLNPFFNIFNSEKIGARLKSCKRTEVDNCRFVEQKAPPMPPFIRGNYNNNYGNPEPFDGLFFWLSQNFKPLYLDATTHKDNMSSILLDHEAQPIVFHSWYSRQYGVSVEQTTRINSLYNEALNESSNHNTVS